MNLEFQQQMYRGHRPVNVVLASGNAGKLEELNAVLSPLGVTLCTQRQLGISDADETAITFVENALIKARHAAAASNLPAIADDSGLVVAALGGAPGVLSARYAGSPSDAAANNRKLIEALAGVRGSTRVFLLCAGVPAQRRGSRAAHRDRQPGTVASSTSRAAHGGFGYDPHFLVDGYDQTAARLARRR